MKTKKGDRLLLIAVAIVALSLILQALGMKSILQVHTLGDNYENGHFVELFLGDNQRTKVPKEILDAQFSKYKYVSDYGETFNLFTIRQVSEFLTKRERGFRDPLNVDEVLYIIEDSIDAYFTYERVVFTGESAQTTAGGVLYYSVGFPDSYSSYDELYSIVLSHISQIICYRLIIHDAGFMRAYHSSNGVLGIFSETRLNVGKDNNYYTAMLIDEGSFSDDAYKSRLGTMLLEYIINVDPEGVKDAKDHDSIRFYSPALSVTDSTGEIIMWDTMTHVAVRLFPTSSLEERINEKLGME